MIIFKSVHKLKEKHFDRWADVCEAIQRKLDGEEIPITPTTLKLWAKDLGFEPV